MAEICCGVVSDSEKSPTYEPSSRAARRRRMEIRRFKFVGGVAPPETADESKRRKVLEFFGAPFSRDSEINAVRDCGLDRDEKRVCKADNGETEMTKEMMTCTSCCSLNVSKSRLCKTSPESSAEIPRFGFSSLCGRRRDMEDAVAVHPSFCCGETDNSSPFHYFAVYDGHGCSHVATKCRERLHEIVKEELQSKGESTVDWKSAMEQSFHRMDKEVIASIKGAAVVANCRCELQSPECDAVGSTAVVAVVGREKIIVANCGDSRAVLCRNGKAIPLSSDHKPDRPDELSRIESAGGRVIYWDGPRVLGVLAMSRAIGDNYLKPYVSREPEVTITDRTGDDDCLIIASDGLWDVVSNETACSVARMCLRGKDRVPESSSTEEGEFSGREMSDRACNNASMLLSKLALARHSTDNVSVVVVGLRRVR